MNKIEDIEMLRLIGADKLKELPMTVRLVHPKLIDTDHRKALKITKNKYYQDNMVACHSFHKPISKML